MDAMRAAWIEFTAHETLTIARKRQGRAVSMLIKQTIGQVTEATEQHGQQQVLAQDNSKEQPPRP